MAALPGHKAAVRSVILSSELRTATPADLEAAAAKATLTPSTLIDDFADGWRDWYRLSINHPGAWSNWTRKVTDPVWRGPAGATLAVTLTMPRTNRIRVEVVENEWRGERGPRRRFACPREIPGGPEPQTVLFALADFTSADGKEGPLASWDEVDLLGLCGLRTAPGPDRPNGWDGPDPEFHRVEWRP